MADKPVAGDQFERLMAALETASEDVNGHPRQLREERMRHRPQSARAIPIDDAWRANIGGSWTLTERLIADSATTWAYVGFSGRTNFGAASTGRPRQVRGTRWVAAPLLNGSTKRAAPRWFRV